MRDVEDAEKNIVPENMKAKEDNLNHSDFLVEYQAAQNSAQHHDNLVWPATSVMWGASLILIGFVLNNLSNANLRPLITASGILGIMLCVFVLRFRSQYASIKNQKYTRCKELEKLFGFRQHSNLSYPRGSMQKLYCVVTVFFIVTWVVVIWIAWKPVIYGWCNDLFCAREVF
jgi:hypothetical protein